MPGDFKEFFDINKLSMKTLGQIEFVLNSPAYEEGFRPFIQGILTQMHQLYKDRSTERKNMYPDDFLAGGEAVGDKFLEFFDKLIQETNMERIHSSMSGVTEEQMYKHAQEAGRMKPVVGLDQPALPEEYDPAEDY